MFCGYGKNYRLQDIQLRKNDVNVSADDRDDFHHRKLTIHSRSRCRRPMDSKNLEDTGLEPVTSWLQTRRSPS